MSVVLKMRAIESDGVHCLSVTKFISDEKLPWIPLAQIITNRAYCTETDKHRCDNIFLSICACLLHGMRHSFLQMYGCFHRCSRASSPKDVTEEQGSSNQ